MPRAMDDWSIAVLTALATGGLAWRAARSPLLAWVALAPLGLAVVITAPPWAALAGAIAGVLVSVSNVWTRTLRSLVPITTIPSALAWGLGFGGAAWIVEATGPEELALVLPATVVFVSVPLRVMGAPRWVSNPLARTQERWLAVVHTARLGGDLVPTALLALASAGIVLVALGSMLIAGLAAIVVLAVLAFGALSARAAVRRVSSGRTVRVAAIVADGARPPSGEVNGLWPTQSQEYRDVDATVRRYEPLVERAAEEGARLVVLPEVGVYVDGDSRDRWIECVTRWAARHRLAIVAPFFDASVPKNALVIIDERGVVDFYEKQHPARGLEPGRERRMRPGPHRVRAGDDTLELSTVICVDLDYGDLIGPVRASGGILAAPSNDWFGGFEELHHQTAVWSAVMTGVTTVRATGHGISSVIDGAGRVLARQSSLDGPVVLIVDAPLTEYARRGPGIAPS